MFKKLFWLLANAFIISLLFATCKKADFAQNGLPQNHPGFNIPAASPVQGSVSGIVVDENNRPVASANVKYAGANYQTDAKGFFTIKNVTLDKYVSTITINMNGYFQAIRSFSATSSHNYLTIKLIPKRLAGTINSATGGTVGLSNGTSIVLPTAGVVLKNTGVAYAGAINVYAAYIDPTSSDFKLTVPGSMMGQDSSKMYVLQSTGMIAVNLESPGGEALQLASGKTASVTLPIPSGLVNKAPAEIDTWSLDARGVWIKEGTARKNGNNYTMQVSHFSFWNCDVPSNAVYLDLHVQNQNGQAVANSVVSLTVPNNNTWWATTYGVTDSAGHVAGLVPANMLLEMNIFASAFNCVVPINTQNIGPFATDTALQVSIVVPQTQMLTVSGTVNNCSNQPVQNGIAVIYAGTYGIYHASINNGSYTAVLNYCDNSNATLSVTATDFSTQTQSSSGELPISGNTITVPILTACTSMASAVYSITSCSVNGSYQTHVPMNANNFITATIVVTSVGNYSIMNSNGIFWNGIRFSKSGIFTTPGTQTLIIPASGTPTGAGTTEFFLLGDSTASCVCPVNFTTGPNPAPAVFTFESTGQCQSTSTSGESPAGMELTNANYFDISINVSATGSYDIHTGNPVNGAIYRDAGVFTSTGTQVVRLRGTGTPAVAGTFQYQVQGNNITGCSFSKTFPAAGQLANISFINSPGTCNIVSDPVRCFAGIPLKDEWFLVRVQAANAGWCSISTNTINGVKFSGNNYLPWPGEHSVVLMPSGTPIAWRTDTFTPVATNQLQGCNFIVQAHIFNF